MEGLDKVKRVILKHGLKQDNPFVRDVRHSTTGEELEQLGVTVDD
ncbi:TPA: hypothetical protein ACIRI2_001990 [Streptococcus suis]